MTTSTAIAAVISTPEMHSKYRGDADAVIRTITKKGAYKPLNDQIKLKLLDIDIDKLVPLQSQRYTEAKWTKDRILELGGLDMWAFGTLSVCLDPRDGIYYVWDGCGRWALAQLYKLKQVPCVVIEGPKEQAAFYFAYNQDRGRRTLSKEVLFVNRVYAGDITALEQVQQLNTLGLYIKGDTDYITPHPVQPGAIEIGYRTFSEAVKNANGDLPFIRSVRDMIATAWSNSPDGCQYITQDTFWALLTLLEVYPAFKKNGAHTNLQHYLNNIATSREQKRVEWKPKGLSGNSGVRYQLAYGLLTDFKKTTFWKASFNNLITIKILEDKIKP
jgi:hypothetical protein